MQNHLEMTPETALIETIDSSDLGSLAADLAETTLDEFLQDGIVRDIPFVSILLNMVKTGVDISNFLFMRKTLRFLSHLADIPSSERRAFASRIDADKAFKQRVGENLLLLLHRQDDMQKPDLLGRAFKAYVRGKVDYSTYQRLATAVDRVRLYDIDYLVGYYAHPPDAESANQEILQALAFCGLVGIPNPKGVSYGPAAYAKTSVGELFIELVLE